MKYLYNIGCSFSEGNGIAEARGGDFFNQGPTDKGKELEAKSRYSAVLSKKLGLEEISTFISHYYKKPYHRFMWAIERNRRW